MTEKGEGRIPTVSPMAEGGIERLDLVKKYQHESPPQDVFFHGSRYGKLDLEEGSPVYGGGLWLAKDVIYAQNYAKDEDLKHVYPFVVKARNPFNTENKEQVKVLARLLIKWYPSKFRYKGLVDDLSVEDLQSHSLYDMATVQATLIDLDYDVVFNGSKTEALVLGLEDSLEPLPKPTPQDTVSPMAEGGIDRGYKVRIGDTFSFEPRRGQTGVVTAKTFVSPTIR